MIGRQIPIGFGIAIVLPLLIFYGVGTFSPPPKIQDYVTIEPLGPNATAEERRANTEKREAQRKAIKDAYAQFAPRLFYVSAPLGYIAILIGGFTAVTAVGSGLIFGGIFSVIVGYWCYWDFIANWERFVSLLVAAAIILVIAYGKVPKPG